MNKRNQKALEIAKRIQGVALAVPHEIADVFVEWSPHCHLFGVRAYTGGWREKTEPSVQQSLYVDNENAHETALELYNSLVAYLKGLGCEVVEPNADKPASVIHEVASDLRRENLAGLALQGILTYEGRPSGAKDEIAAEAVAVADALIAALAQPRA